MTVSPVSSRGSGTVLWCSLVVRTQNGHYAPSSINIHLHASLKEGGREREREREEGGGREREGEGGREGGK